MWTSLPRKPVRALGWGNGHDQRSSALSEPSEPLFRARSRTHCTKSLTTFQAFRRDYIRRECESSKPVMTLPRAKRPNSAPTSPYGLVVRYPLRVKFPPVSGVIGGGPAFESRWGPSFATKGDGLRDEGYCAMAVHSSFYPAGHLPQTIYHLYSRCVHILTFAQEPKGFSR